MNPRLERITLRGFKSIRELVDFELRPINILIGANGAGKSNFISFFRMLSAVLTPPTGELQEYIRVQGGASAQLHDGPKRTRTIEANLFLGKNFYGIELVHAAGDTLAIGDEWFLLGKDRDALEAGRHLSGSGIESSLPESARDGNEFAQRMIGMLAGMVVYQFHDTSSVARMRNKWDAEDGWRLKEDGANLAPFLYRLQTQEPAYYRRITDTIRLILPFFADFEFQLDFGKLLLKWREIGSDVVFNASQAADGMLRVMALIALLQQPEKDLPLVLILDEPELGLHPYAIEVLVGTIRSVANHVQVIVATQSVSLIDRFDPEDIVVVDRKGRESTFRRLSEPELEDWLEDYTLSELWEKNVLGGRPSR